MPLRSSWLVCRGGFKRPRIEDSIARALRTSATAWQLATIAYALQNGSTAAVENDLGLWTGLVPTQHWQTIPAPATSALAVQLCSRRTAPTPPTLPRRTTTARRARSNCSTAAPPTSAAVGSQIPVDVTTNLADDQRQRACVPTYNTVSRRGTHYRVVQRHMERDRVRSRDDASGAWTARGLIGTGTVIAQTSPWYLRIIKNTPWTTVIGSTMYGTTYPDPAAATRT